MYEGITRQVVDFSVKTNFADFPRATVEVMKQVLLDSLGCALGSYITDRSRLAIEFVEESGGAPQASIIGGRRTSYAQASFANGELINALDYDVLGPLNRHISPYVIPSCLAAAERVHASGKDLITALILAHEIAGRVAASIAGIKVAKGEAPYFEESRRFTHSYAVFGGVIGASKLLGLDAEKTANAFGIAGASCPVPSGIKWQHHSGPAIMVKYNAWAGWTAQLATTAAILAEKGFTGDESILDGEWGFWQIVASPFFKVENILNGLGKTWHTSLMDFKPYPICRFHHAGIQGVDALVRKHSIKPEDIDQIVIKSDPHLLAPTRLGTEITNFGDMQFSNVNIFALAACYGSTPSPAWQMPIVYNDSRVKSLAKKVKVEAHPNASALTTAKMAGGLNPAFWDTLVEITAKGKKYTTEVVDPKGTPTNPFTEKELYEKFRNNASFASLNGHRVEEIIDTVDKLEKLDDYSKLARLLTIG